MSVFPDLYSESSDRDKALKQALSVYEAQGYTYQDFVDYISRCIRRFKPLVVVSHDLDGEYGHGTHVLCAKALGDALAKAADPSWNSGTGDNSEAWQEVTRTLILHDTDFLPAFLDELIRLNVIDQPLSLERRGILLYDFCQKHYPTFARQVSQAWIEAGLSLKKKPAEKVRTKCQTPPEHWQVLKGHYHPGLRLCFLPADTEAEQGIWYGYESEIQAVRPVFKAVGTE